MPLSEIPITVRAKLGPIELEIPAKPAQIAMVVRMATEELILAKIIGMGGQSPFEVRRVDTGPPATQDAAGTTTDADTVVTPTVGRSRRKTPPAAP